MSKKDGLLVLLCVVLALLAGIYGVRVARHYREARTELGRVKLTALDDSTVARLHALEDELFLTYYVSPRSKMPSHLRRMEAEVTDLLRAFKREGGARVGFQIVDPDSSPDLSKYAAGRRIAPFRVRTVTRDAYTEETVWSTLSIAYGPNPPAVINGIVPEHLPRLQRILTEHLALADTPRPPHFVLSTPRPVPESEAGSRSTFTGLAQVLGSFGKVTELCIEAGDPVPEDVDVVFWMDPGEVGQESVDALSKLLARGRSVVLAGSAYAPSVEPPDGNRDAPAGTWQFLPVPQPFGAEALFVQAGLRPLRGNFLDEFADALPLAGQTQLAPFVFRCIAPQQNFRTLVAQPNGTLLFATPTPFTLEPDVLAERGWIPQVLATSSDRTFLHPAPDAPVALQDLTAAAGTPAPQQALAVLLRPTDPWRGSLVACSSASVFADGVIQREGHAHPQLVAVLARQLASTDRLVIHRAGFVPKEPLPPLAAEARLFWRAAVVLAFPGLLLALALVRGFTRRPGSTREGGVGAGFALRTALLLAGVLLAIRGTGLVVLRADLTEDHLNELGARTRELAASSAETGALQARLVFSSRDRLPPALRAPVRRLEEQLADLRRAGARLELERVHPEDLSDGELLELADRGIEPTRTVLEQEGSVTVRKVYTSLELFLGNGRVERLDFPSPASFENLEFKLAFALWRLQSGRAPHVAFASDVPRLSPAESHTDYLTKGLFAPSGTDVYSLARDVLSDAGFRVSHLNPRDPRLTEDIDLLIWMQPRRSIEGLLPVVVEHLRKGGALLVAAQHFNIQAQQHRGREFEIVHWPQPQSADIELLYFPEVGIHLERDVLFDELMTRMAQETQVNRGADQRDYERQDEALPFLIRAVAANFADDSVITRGLGDQGFIWGNRIRWDEQRLAELDMTAHTLISSSDRSWNYVWEGGFLPADVLAGPPVSEDGTPQWLGRQPLAVLFEGHFPNREQDPPAADAARGRMLLVGDSELFKNSRLFEPDFRGDHFLLNAAAALTLDEGLARVAARRPVARGFDYVPPARRLFWRTSVLALFPVGLFAFGLLRALWRRRGLRGISA